uniref:ABC transporter domain-containing protein n=1 Tax=Octactis speculum TaxID=3111310 RepID=A0A7S2AJ01_9STRA|mmetsp:Transcript_10872/g.14363  ORF Transcript_10872/g.14363 Transcript_10872/m.14363 type:complete len:458 (+) Transcript_10872:2-1375(+)
MGIVMTTYLFGNALGDGYLRQAQREASLRFGLMRVREAAEEIAFLGGDWREAELIRTLFRQVVDVASRLVLMNGLLEGWQNTFEWTTTVVPYLFLADRYFADGPTGGMEMGVLTQSVTAFRMVQASLAGLMQETSSIAQLSARTKRLHELMDALEQVEGAQETLGQKEGEEDALLGHGTTKPQHNLDRCLKVVSIVQVPVSEGGMGYGEKEAVLELDDLTLQSPSQREHSHVLCSGLSLSLLRSERCLVRGPSGCGKSSLLRAIAGLWRNGSGIITRPSDDRVAFLPQKPYLLPGSLRDQLLYPKKSEGSVQGDQDIVQVLNTVRLGGLFSCGDRLPEGLDTVRSDWIHRLSLGEQQRIGIARLLLRSPPPVLAFLDEATASLDIDTERACYEALVDAGLCIVSVGHRPSLAGFHTHALDCAPADVVKGILEHSSSSSNLNALSAAWTFHPITAQQK